MAMENSTALSNDATEEISSPSKVDLPGIDKQGTQQSGTEESLREEKFKDDLDPEGDFVDAEAVAEDESMPTASALDANISDLGIPSEDAKGGDVGIDDENGSVESFDSALERMAVASTGDPASPEGPSSPISQPAETTQQIALRQLNQMNSGVSSLDTVLLQNVGPVEFKMRVAEIAHIHGLSADSENVVRILSVLLPLVEGEDDKPVGEVGVVGSEGSKDTNALVEGEDNKPVGEVGDVGSEGSKDTNVLENAEVTKQENPSQVEANGDVSTNQAVDLEGHPMEAMQSQDVHDDADTTKKLTTTLDVGDDFSKVSLPADSSKKSSDSEDRVGDGTPEIQASKTNDFEQEPEVIDWDALNDSDADDHASSNVQLPPSEVKDTKEVVGGGTVESDGLQQESGTSNAEYEPTASAAEEEKEAQMVEPEAEEKEAPKLEPEAALPGGNVVMDNGIEPKVQPTGVNGEESKGPEALEVQETSGEVEGSGNLGAAEQAEFEQAGTVDEAKEVDVNKSEVAEALEESIPGRDSSGIEKELSSGNEDYAQTSEVAEQPPAEVVVGSEEVEAKPIEFEVEGQANGTDESPEQASTRAENSVVSEKGDLESEALGDSDLSKGLEVGSATQVSDPKDNEIVEPQLLEGLSKGEESLQESPAVEAAGDASVKGEDSVLENASLMPAVADSKKEENVDSLILEKTVDVSSKEEDSVDEKPSLVAATVESSKASTTPGNDATSSLGGAGPSLPVRPAGLGRSVPSLEHAPRAVQRSSAVPASVRQASATDEENGSSTDVSEGSEDAREKLQMIRVKFLRLANRLGQSAHNVVVAQVLYRLGLAEQLRGGRGTGRTGAFSFERASALAEEQEAAGTDDLEFGCTIMVLGKSGVGKSATINSLFDEVKSGTNAYSPATNKVQEIIGTVHGIKLRVIDTPGLLTSFADQRRNERIMSSVKRFIKKSPPDIVLYFDRLDMQSRDYGDLPLLRTITDTFGSAVWFNAIVVLTHASSAPPDGANGVPVSYEMFVAQRSHVVQQTIRQAAGDMRLMNPVSLVENHAACRRNRAGERVLPNGQVWKPQLLLLCFASKILAEANSLLKLQDNSPAKPFGVRSRVPPLPFLLSSLLQSRAQLKLPDEQIGSDDESEDESDEEADSEGEEEYDDLPPFRRLTKDELKLLDKEQRKIYAEELEYREKLFMKKQLKDERARKKELRRRMAALPKEAVQFAEENFEDENASASVPVPMPDMALPPSFDSDNPTYRYRYLDTANQWLVRPVLETHGWDHDSGYDGLNVEKMFVISKKIPVSVSGQVTKDKKEANLQMECAASFKNGEGKFTQTGLDIQTIGKDLAYTLRSETRFDNFKRNKTTCGLAVTLLGDTVAAGMKIEDRLLLGKRVKLVFNGGALTGRGDVAYGGSLEATIRDKDYPIGQFLSTFGLSVMDWHGDLAIGGNLQVQCKLGKTMTIVRGNLNNRKAGQISIRISNSEQLQIALIGLIPLLRTFINNRILSSN